MFFATGTNISAFIPMLVSSGSTAEFTKSIPIVSIITMITAFIMALFIVPVFSALVLKNTTQSQNKKEYTSRIFEKVGEKVANRPIIFIVISLIVISISAAGFIIVKKQFFPQADRNQLLVELNLDDGSSPKATLTNLKILTEHINTIQEVNSHAAFVGEEIPRFYYNVGLGDWGPHTAKILLTTKNKKNNQKVIEQIHEFSEVNLKNVFVLTKKLEQGPPILAPIEYRIFSENSETLKRITSEINNILSANKNIFLVKDDIGNQVEQIKLNFNRDLTERFFLNEQTLALSILSSTTGLAATKFIEDGQAKYIRLLGQEISSLNELKSIPIYSNPYRNLRLADVAEVKIEKGDAVIHRMNGLRIARSLAWPKEHFSADQIMNSVNSSLEKIKDHEKIKIEIGGEVEGAGDANMSILKTIPLGLFVLIVCLLLEFNSLRKMIIILLSVPFVIAGVTPGLILGNAAFGFMSLLGVLALVGIVVNNSILLIESIDEFRDSGLGLESAIKQALATRARPIILTAVTTIAGVLPMAFEESTLWPPLAWAMITGLIGSTLITLLFVPSLYVIFFQPQKFLRFKSMKTTTCLAVLLISILKANPLEAKNYSLGQALNELENSSIQIQKLKAENNHLIELSSAQSKAAFSPKIGLQAEYKKLDEQQTQTNPFGTFNYGRPTQVVGGIEITQPILNLEQMSGERKKMRFLVAANEHKYEAEKQYVKLNVAFLLIELRKLELTKISLTRLEKSLLGIEKEVKKFQTIGQAGKSDLANVRMAISENRANQLKVEIEIINLKKQIQIHLPDFENLIYDFGNTPAKIDFSLQKIRPEISALQALVESEKAALESIKLGHFPTVEVKAKHLYVDAGLIDQKQWNEVSLVLSLPIFEGGTRSSKASAQAEIVKSVGYRLKNLESQFLADQINLQGRVHEVEFKIGEARKNLILAEEALLEDKKSSSTGKTPLKDWLNSEIRFEQKKLELENLTLDKVKLKYENQLISGVQLTE
jgi:outer membrane protein TolC/preprotein translocase subunit SecF